MNPARETMSNLKALDEYVLTVLFVLLPFFVFVFLHFFKISLEGETWPG